MKKILIVFVLLNCNLKALAQGRFNFTGNINILKNGAVSSFSALFDSAKIKNELEICKNLNIEELKFKNESSELLSAEIETVCSKEVLKIKLKIEKQLFFGNVDVSKLSDGRFLLSNNRFRVQIFLDVKNKKCDLTVFDILENRFYNSNVCKLK